MRATEGFCSGARGDWSRRIVRRLSGVAKNLLPYFALAATLWVVRYWHSAHFGLYEDDLTIIPRAVTLPWADLLRYVAYYIVHLYGHARPLSDSLINLLSHVGWEIGDLWGPYWVGFAIEALNLGLFAALLKRVHGQALALTGAMAYVLYSADTTQAFLNHSLGLHPSITLLLLASHAYLSGRRLLAYLLVFVILFSYETPFTVFFGIPLLALPWDRRWLKRFLGHCLILGMMLAAVLVFRAAMGEGRVTGLGLREMVSLPVIHMVEGPVVSLGTYLYRPLQALQAMDAEIALVSVVFFGITVWIAERTGRGAGRGGTLNLRAIGAETRARSGTLAAVRTTWGGLPQEIQSLLRLALAGLVMLILAYPLTFTVRAYAISGRDTRVHAAGVVGAATLVGCLILLAVHVAQTIGRRRWASIVIGIWLGLLAGYGFVIQRDYTLAWQYQRDFWSALVRLVPDVREGTAILVDPEGLVDTRQIGANYWNLPRVLEQLYVFPEEWSPPPRVYRLATGWQQRIATDEGMLLLDETTVFAPPSTYGTVDPANTVLILTAGGGLTRTPGPVIAEGQELGLRPLAEEGEPPYPHDFLYQYMIQEISVGGTGAGE